MVSGCRERGRSPASSSAASRSLRCFLAMRSEDGPWRRPSASATRSSSKRSERSSSGPPARTAADSSATSKAQRSGCRIESRRGSQAAGRLATQIVRDFPGRTPAVLPPEWLGPITAPGELSDQLVECNHPPRGHSASLCLGRLGTATGRPRDALAASGSSRRSRSRPPARDLIRCVRRVVDRAPARPQK